MYEVLCNISTGLKSSDARRAMVELLDEQQIISMDSAEDQLAFDIAVVTDDHLSPIVYDLSIFCSQSLVIMRALTRLELCARR